MATLIGLTLTFDQAREARVQAQHAEEQAKQAKTAATAATEAVSHVRFRVEQTNTVSDLKSIINGLKELKNLQRSDIRSDLPNRYNDVRLMTLALDTATQVLTDEHRETLLSVTAQFSILEDQAERHIAGYLQRLNRAKMNKIVSEQMDKLTKILAEVESKIGAEDGG
jgi:hypothetical protein